jgi:hypothetical protein
MLMLFHHLHSQSKLMKTEWLGVASSKQAMHQQQEDL